jgi:hypothetical protein
MTRSGQRRSYAGRFWFPTCAFEVFYFRDKEPGAVGWYWQPYLPNGKAEDDCWGPFKSAKAAFIDATRDMEVVS